MMYDREHAPGEIKLRFHIRNKRGEDIAGALRYDPDTANGIRRTALGSEEAFFAAGGFVEIDGYVNPIKEELEAIYASVRSHLSAEVRDATVRKVIEDARQPKKQELASVAEALKRIGIEDEKEIETLLEPGSGSGSAS